MTTPKDISNSLFRRLAPSCRIDVLSLDMASLSSVRAFVSEVASNYEAIDAIVCNAGVWDPDVSAKTADGFEVHFGVNHIAHFLIVDGLMDNLLKSGTYTMHGGCHVA